MSLHAGSAVLLLAFVGGALEGCVQERSRRLPSSFRVRGGTPVAAEASPTRGAESARGPKAFDASRAGARAQDEDVLHADVTAAPRPGELSPFHRFDWNLIRNPDGTLTKLFYVRSPPNGPGAASYVELLKRFIPGFAGLAPEQDYWIKEKFLIDPRKESHDVWDTGATTSLTFGNGQVADLFMVTASEDMLRQIDEFLASVIADIPQIEIETTIVEIAVEDALTTGIKMFVQRGTESDPESNLIDNVAVKLTQDLLTGAFGTFKAVHDETVVNGVLELLEATTDSEILSSPKLAVLNGHRAIIDAGAETPYFTPSFNATGITTIGTTFKPTGISVVVTPFVLTADMVQLEISVEVSAVTGFVSAGVGTGAEVENPLISRRNAHTVVNVPSGKTVMIGGLVATDDIRTEEKVPLLGDIPLLGYLFKSTHDSFRKAQVIFFVKPKIVENRYREGEIYDPAEELRR